MDSTIEGVQPTDVYWSVTFEENGEIRWKYTVDDAANGDVRYFDIDTEDTFYTERALITHIRAMLNI